MTLAGRGVVVTRPRGLAEPMVELLEREGARAIVFPVIDIVPLPVPAALSQLARYDLVVFVSPSAVRAALGAAPQWPGARAAAVGQGTRRELERLGVRDVIAPDEAAESEALLELPALQAVAGKRVLIVRGEGGRALLRDTLAARGARVEYAECYRRERPSIDAAPLVEQWRRGEVDAVTIFSSQALDNFVAMAGFELASATPLFVPHRRVASHASQIGIRGAIVAGSGEREMVDRLVAYFHERN